MPLLKDFDVVALELPGRGRRMGEQLLTEFDAAAEDIYRQIKARITSPAYIIYGHSMGAYLGLRAANLLQRSGKPPAYLIVSGNPGPGIPERDPGKRRYRLRGEAFINELKDLGGMPDELLEDKDLFEFYEPILRADFEVAEEHHLENEPPVELPLFAMMGAEEEKAEEISNWKNFTTGDFDAELMAGRHFFIFDQADRISFIIKKCYHKILKERYI